MNNYAEQISNLIQDISSKTEELKHISTDNIAISFKKSRSDSSYGVWAEVSGLEWKNNYLCVRTGRTERYFITEPVFMNGAPIKYHIEFYIPRFLNLSFREKLITVFHELYHISPKFNGALRLFPGKNYMHGKSQKEYDAHMGVLADRYLKHGQDRSAFLGYNSEQLNGVYGTELKPVRFSAPKPLLFRITMY